MLNQLSLGFDFREAKEFCTHVDSDDSHVLRIEPAGLVKTHDGQHP